MDLPALRGALRAVDNEGRNAAELPLRSLSEICDAAEHIYSLRWVSVELQSDTPSQTGPGTLQPQDHSTLVERHRAVAWLTDPVIAYDDVDLST